MSIFYIFGDNTDKILCLIAGIILFSSLIPLAIMGFMLEGEEKEKFNNERKYKHAVKAVRWMRFIISLSLVPFFIFIIGVLKGVYK